MAVVVNITLFRSRYLQCILTRWFTLLFSTSLGSVFSPEEVSTGVCGRRKRLKLRNRNRMLFSCVISDFYLIMHQIHHQAKAFSLISLFIVLWMLKSQWSGSVGDKTLSGQVFFGEFYSNINDQKKSSQVHTSQRNWWAEKRVAL